MQIWKGRYFCKTGALQILQHKTVEREGGFAEQDKHGRGPRRSTSNGKQRPQ